MVGSVDRILNEMKMPRSVLVCGMTYKPNTEDMRDSPGFKVAVEFVGAEYDTAVYDPYLDINMIDKYLKENYIKQAGFVVAPELQGKFSCLCVCQHHAQIIPKLERVYARGVFPLIYDCQGRLKYNSNVPTRLEWLGG